MGDQQKDPLKDAGGKRPQFNLLGDIWGMLRENKKFWLIPLILGLLILGLLIFLGGTTAAPFIYTLF